MLHPDLERLIRDAWAMVASEMGPAFLKVSWVKAPNGNVTEEDDLEELPLAA